MRRLRAVLGIALAGAAAGVGTPALEAQGGRVCTDCDTVQLRSGETVLIRRTPESERRRETIHIIRQNPRGYLGVVFSSAMVIDSSGSQPVLRFNDYPRIEAVEPGSPAARAGILAGDLLLAVNGRDVRQGAEPLDKLLVPGRRIVVRVTRDGTARDVPVTLAARPPARAFGTGHPGAPGADPARVGIEILRAPGARGATPTPAAASGGGPPGASPAAQTQPGRVTAGMVNPGTFALAGMELTTINAGLAEYFGVGSGVLVLRVAPNGPAGRAGLRDGDVIVAADGSPVANRGTLVAAVIEAESRRTLKLDVIRMKAAQSVTLRW